MASVTAPAPDFLAAVLHELLAANPREDGAEAALRGIVGVLSPAEAEQLPSAIGRVLHLLHGDIERLRFVAEILVRFDFFEASEALTSLALGTRDPDLVLAAAAICGNPAASQRAREQLSAATADDRTARMRFDGTVAPNSADDKLLYWQCWPGSRPSDREPPLAPVVVLDLGLQTDAALRLACRLIDVGASVRRLAPAPEPPNWFGPQTVVVCLAATRLRIRESFPDFALDRLIVDTDISSDAGQARLLRRINAALPASRRLHLDALQTEFITTVWDPEVYRLGVYETRESAFLTGASTNQLSRLARADLLVPARREPITIWSFNHLVAIRAWRYFAEITGRRISTNVLRSLANFAGHETAVDIGVTADASVLVDNGDGWYNITRNHPVLPFDTTEMIKMDDAFQPFEIGGHRVPDLLEASENTRLHPAFLNGSPHLANHRITARALAQMHDSRGTEQGRQRILREYPELDGVNFEDTVGVGRRLLKGR